MAKEIKVHITDPVGLYATPATELVKAIKVFNCQVNLHYEDKTVNIEGPDEVAASNAIKQEIVSLNIGEIV